MGPVSVILLVASGSCLRVDFFQFLTGSSMGLSDLNEPGMLSVTGSAFLLAAAMAYIVFIRNINLVEKLTFWIDECFQELLDSMMTRFL